MRLISTPAENQTFWGAISRAIRSPARFNHDGKLVLGVQAAQRAGTAATSAYPERNETMIPAFWWPMSSVIVVS